MYNIPTYIYKRFFWYNIRMALKNIFGILYQLHKQKYIWYIIRGKYMWYIIRKKVEKIIKKKRKVISDYIINTTRKKRKEKK